jgi:hypothetical protein
MKKSQDEIYHTLVPSLSDRLAHQKVKELNLEGAKQYSKKIKIGILAALLVTALGTFSYIAYNSYKYTVKPVVISEIRLIKRDIAPLRILPADPGGEQFLNQDKLIYNNFEDPQIREAQSHIIKQEKDGDPKNPLYKATAESVVAKEDFEEKFNQTRMSHNENIEGIQVTPTIKNIEAISEKPTLKPLEEKKSTHDVAPVINENTQPLAIKDIKKVQDKVKVNNSAVKKVEKNSKPNNNVEALASKNAKVTNKDKAKNTKEKSKFITNPFDLLSD